MFCPNCGANNSTEQKFCRSCGLNLEKSAESLIEQLPSAQSANLLRHEKTIERFGNFALGGFCVVSIIGVIVLMRFLILKFLVPGTDGFAILLLTAFIFFAVLSLVFVIFNEWLKEKKAKLGATLNNELAKGKPTGKLLEARPFEVASVVENSTELLYTESKTRNFK